MTCDNVPMRSESEKRARSAVSSGQGPIRRKKRRYISTADQSDALALFRCVAAVSRMSRSWVSHRHISGLDTDTL
eukprot:177471-Prorocentrum_minimum.AAC.6